MGTSRPDPSPRSRSEEDAEEESIMYFDKLPSGCLENCTRLMSTEPNLGSWSQGISGSHILKLYKINGSGFKDYLRDQFEEVCVRGALWLFGSNNKTVFIEDFQIAFDVLRIAGRHIKSLRWEDAVPTSMSIDDLIRDIKPICTGLVSFMFNKSSPKEWIEVFGPQMEKFEMSYGAISEDIELLVRKKAPIRTLNLGRVDITSLHDNNLWKSIGNTLEVLAIHIEDDYDTGRIKIQIAQIKKYCRKLYDIKLQSHSESSIDGLAHCIASYKGALKYVTLGYICADDLEFIVTNCKEANYCLKNMQDDTNAQLKSVGSLLHCVCVAKGEGDPTIRWDECSNLRQIEIIGSITAIDLTALFNKPKPLLECLEIDLSGENINIDNCMDVFGSKKITSLERITITLKTPPGTIFETLVSQNKKLSYVFISIYGSDDEDAEEVEKIMSKLTRTFLGSESLSYLFIDHDNLRDYPSDALRKIVEEKCKNRRIKVNILGVRYM